MSNTTRTHVALLYGGRSGEHEISLISAYSVFKNLNRELYEVTPIGIDKKGTWYRNQENEIVEPGQAQLLIQGPHSVEITSLKKGDFDVIFPMMHGPLYEDGALQGSLELTEIPYVGCGVIGSAIAMDKSISKQLAIHAGLPVVPFISVSLREWQQEPKAIVRQIIESLSYPVFIKPANLGSSVGMHHVKNNEQLFSAMNDAFQYDHKVLIEKAVVSRREIEVGIIENSDPGQLPLTSEIGEIILDPRYEFYDYTAKYLDPTAVNLQIPAKLTLKQTQDIKHYAQKAFIAFNCNGYARVDFLVDKEHDNIYFSELNTIPGFTQLSMFPLMWMKSGLSYSDLLTRLIDLGLKRSERLGTIKREWHRK